jgi:hypothetical protein
VLLVAVTARAEDDVFGTGDGHNGPGLVAAADTVLNAYQLLTADAPEGSTTLTLQSSSGFAGGDLLVLVQFTGFEPSPISGDTTPMVLDGGQGIAAFEWARVASVSGLTLNLTQPLIANHRGLLTQAVKVPEFTTLTVEEPYGRNPISITAPAWNGSTGGIVVLLATGMVTLKGPIDVSGRGFRGGVAMGYTGGVTTCGVDVTPPVAEMKGEGIAAGRYGLTVGGPGNAGNGGGGASNCGTSGGGSGGSGGAQSRRRERRWHRWRSGRRPGELPDAVFASAWGRWRCRVRSWVCERRRGRRGGADSCRSTLWTGDHPRQWLVLEHRPAPRCGRSRRRWCGLHQGAANPRLQHCLSHRGERFW